ncbi:MAG TPA: type II secretion system protein GspM [Bryobacteraceae bacterium]|nr:type II secretion system protein GspM [Bryobacteraceae bacterium]
MNVSERERRLLIVAAIAVPAILIYYFATSSSSSSTPEVAAPADTPAMAERRLADVRRRAAAVPEKEAVLKQVSADLTRREKGLIQADTAPQAQALLLQIVKRVAKAQTPPVELGQVEMSEPRAYGSAYGEVAVTISMRCGIDQLVDMISDLSAQPELVATNEMRIGAAHEKLKTMPVRMVVSALVPRRLVPEKKGPAAF